MKNILSLLLVFCGLVLVSSQKYTVEGTVQDYHDKTMLQRLLDCVGKLSETLRTTMEFFLDDCSMEVISERQGINVATVKSRLHAARKLVVECGRKGVPNHV